MTNVSSQVTAGSQAVRTMRSLWRGLAELTINASATPWTRCAGAVGADADAVRPHGQPIGAPTSPCCGPREASRRALTARVRRPGSPPMPRAMLPWCRGRHWGVIWPSRRTRRPGPFAGGARSAPAVGTFKGDWVVAAPNGDFVAVGHNVTSSGNPIAITLVRYASDGTLLWRVDLARTRLGGAAARRRPGQRLPRVQLGR